MTFEDFLVEYRKKFQTIYPDSQPVDIENTAWVAWQAFGVLRNKYQAVAKSQEQFAYSHYEILNQMKESLTNIPLTDPMPMKQDGIDRAVKRLKDD